MPGTVCTWQRTVSQATPQAVTHHLPGRGATASSATRHRIRCSAAPPPLAPPPPPAPSCCPCPCPGFFCCPGALCCSGSDSAHSGTRQCSSARTSSGAASPSSSGAARISACRCEHKMPAFETCIYQCAYYHRGTNKRLCTCPQLPGAIEPCCMSLAPPAPEPLASWHFSYLRVRKLNDNDHPFSNVHASLHLPFPSPSPPLPLALPSSLPPVAPAP